MGYQFFLPMVLRWHALRAEARLLRVKSVSSQTCSEKYSKAISVSPNQGAAIEMLSTFIHLRGCLQFLACT